MNFFLLTQLIDSKKLLYLSILVSFSIIAYYHVSIGHCMCGDAKTYSEWGDDLIKLNFNLFNYYDQNNFFTPSFFYTVPVTLVALLKVFFWEWMGIRFLCYKSFSRAIFSSYCLKEPFNYRGKAGFNINHHVYSSCLT